MASREALAHAFKSNILMQTEFEVAMLLELLKVKREAIMQIGEDAAEIGKRLGIKPSWIVYEKKSADRQSDSEVSAATQQQHSVSR